MINQEQASAKIPNKTHVLIASQSSSSVIILVIGLQAMQAMQDMQG